MKKNNINISTILNNKPELLFIIQVLSDKNTIDLNLINKLNNNEFIRLIKHHRLDSIFYKTLKERNIELSAELQNKLEQINKRNKMRMMKLTAELIRIHKLFTENNIDYISLKGPALSQQIYGDYTIRSSRDLDILVREEDLEKVSLLLRNNNYLQDSKLNKRVFHDFSFIKNNIKIEIHFRFFSNKYLMLINNNIFTNKKFVNINGTDINVLSDNNNFKYLNLHGEQHLWSHFYWIYDFYKSKFKNDNKDYFTLNNLIKIFFSNGLIIRNIENIIIVKQSEMQELNKLQKTIYSLKLKSSINYKKEVLLLRLLRLF